MPGHPPINDDLKELIGSFQSHGVEFLVVGAHALAYHGRPRFTEDLDLFVRRNKQNAANIRLALDAFGIHLTDDAEAQLSDNPRGMMVLGHKPTQVDLLNFLDGVSFEDAWQRRVIGRMADIEIGFLSLPDYIATKMASGRERDLVDLNSLREHLGGSLPGE